MKLTANGRRRLQLLTTILLVVTIVAIIYTLVAWIVSEPGSFEPLNVLFFAVLSGLTAVSAWLGRADNVAPPESSMVAEAETIPLGPLRQQIADSFDLDELRTLCLDMGIRYDDLSGDTISTKTTSLVATMQRRGQLAKLTAMLQRERPHITWFVPAQLEQQYGLRRNVRAAWIDGVLKQSVTDEIALELKLTYQPQALVRQTLYVPGQVERPVEKDVPALFAESGSLLILGEPGSGKTMTLLQLAESLLDAAAADPARPTPVVLNLSSWAMQKGALPDWMVEELLLQYQLPRETSRRLIASSGLIYLLDGLDEVAAEARDACVQAINELKAQQPAPLVVCCRVAEYEGLAARLNLGTAVCIQPLTDEQIDDYLRRPELKLTAVRQLVRTDTAMRELAQTPLFLSVMTLAYRDMKRADLKQLPTPEARRTHLYDHYVAEMWRRRPLKDHEPYDETQAVTWMTNLAHGMKQHEQSIFYVEHLQPTWLSFEQFQRYKLIAATTDGLIVGLIVGYLVAVSGGLFLGVLIGLAVWFVIRLGTLLDWGGVFLGSLFGQKIELVEQLEIVGVPWKHFFILLKELAFLGLIVGVFMGLAFGLPIGSAIGLNEGLITGFYFGLVFMLFAIIWEGVSSGQKIFIEVREVQQHSAPNQGIRKTAGQSLIRGLVGGLFVGAGVGVLLGLVLITLSKPYDELSTEQLLTVLKSTVIAGMLIALVSVTLKYGGNTFLQHHVLRLLLFKNHVLPFPFRDGRLIAYLDAMVDRIFLRRVGGGWVFIHRTLLDYFASLHPDATPAPPVILNPAGVTNPHDAERPSS